MLVTVEYPWATGGETYPSTYVWAAADMPEPANGDTLQWDGSHVWYKGVRYAKPEYDSNPSAPLH